MTEFLPRSAWTDDPYPAGATLLVPSEVRGLAIHWPGGSGSVPTTKTATIQILQGELRFHTDPKPAGRGWSDIAYSWAVDQAGRVWDLRGWQRRSAANGDTEVNRQYLAATCLVGPKDVPSPAMLQAVRDLRTGVVLRHYPKATRVVPHSAIRPSATDQPSTDCPGDRLRAHIAAGTFTSTTPIEEDDVALSEDDLNKIKALIPDVRTLSRLAQQDYWERNQTTNVKDFGDGAASPPLRLLEKAAAYAFAGRNAVTALAATVAGLDQIDEDALASQLAPLIAAALPEQVQHLGPADLQAVATAVNDEIARRQAS